MLYNISNQAGQTTITVFGEDGYNKVVPNNHPCFEQVLVYLTGNQRHDEEHVKGLIDPTVGIGRILAEHFGERVSYDLHHLYLDGAKVDGSLARTIKARLFSQDQDWLRFVKFLVNLDANPSHRAQQATWQWVEKNGLTITEDGRFLGYKAVNYDFTSKHAGPNNYIDGALFEEGNSVRVPHVVGSVISKKRADVDDTPGGGCSTGLHVGTREYAENFAPVLVTVAVNPADVVSAPDNDLTFKIRVCKYEVISILDRHQFDTGSYDLSTAPEHPVSVVDIENATEGRYTVVARFQTVAEAETFLDNHPNQAQVERGGFSIDAPEPEEEVDANEGTEFAENHPLVKSAERLAREAEVAALTEDQRHTYESVRKDGHDHQFALAAADPDQDDHLDDEESPFDAYEEQAAEEVLQSTPKEASSSLTLAENAALVPDLAKDLADRSLGHKPLARKWSHLTTEASVRRYRKTNHIGLKVSAKVKDAVS